MEDIDDVHREEQKKRRDKPVVTKNLNVHDAYVKLLINEGLPLSTSSSPHFKELVLSRNDFTLMEKFVTLTLG